MALDPINLYDYEERAKQVLPHNDWDTIDAGAMDMFTTRRNRSAFEALTLRPRFLRDISERDISTTMLGEEISLPVFICPAGSHMKAHADGEVFSACLMIAQATSTQLALGDAGSATAPVLFAALLERVPLFGQKPRASLYRRWSLGTIMLGLLSLPGDAIALVSMGG